MLTIRKNPEPNNYPLPESDNHQPKVTCLCATRGRYELLRASVSYFILQDYPNKELLIFNNHSVGIELSEFVKDQGNIHLINAGEFSATPAAYNAALSYVDSFGGDESEFIAIWDDDDIYFPWHLSTAVKYLSRGTHEAVGPLDKIMINSDREEYPKLVTTRNTCEGSMVVKKSCLKEHGFGPGAPPPARQRHPHPQWTSKVSMFKYPSEDNSFVYFWRDPNRVKSYYHNQTNEHDAVARGNVDTGEGKPLYPGPTYYDFIQKNLYKKSREEEYTEEEKKALIDRINASGWKFFEEKPID